MLKERILSTLQFFDLQDLPLTLMELRIFLLEDLANIRQHLNDQWELREDVPEETLQTLPLSDIVSSLETECAQEVDSYRGFYFLKGRQSLAETRLKNYSFGIHRERLIRKFTPGLRFLPFVRGAALLGSQALGQQRQGSDIDLFIITDPNFLGLARLFVTCYFQFLGLRRHGEKIANRFCLNHYLAGPRALAGDRNLYTAAEYAKMRPLMGAHTLQTFQKRNTWMYLFFPSAPRPNELAAEAQPSRLQSFLESLFRNGLGRGLEEKIKTVQLNRIQKGEFIVADRLELSFHPNNRKAALFSSFFKDQH